jgi:hypothetical protein
MLSIFCLFVTGSQADVVACYDEPGCLPRSKIYVLLFLQVGDFQSLPLKKLQEGRNLILHLCRLTRPILFTLTFLKSILFLKCYQERPDLFFFSMLCAQSNLTLLIRCLFVLYINWYLNFLKMLILLTIHCHYAL